MVYIYRCGIDLSLGMSCRPPWAVILDIQIGRPSIELPVHKLHTELLYILHRPSYTGNSGNMANFYHYKRLLDFDAIYSFYHNMHHCLRFQVIQHHTVHRLQLLNCLYFRNYGEKINQLLTVNATLQLNVKWISIQFITSY